MFSKQDLIDQIVRNELKVDIDAISKACDIAIKAHTGQTRSSGEPYYHHPLEVASILVDMKLDTTTIITSILHDTVEDTELTLEEIEHSFSKEVAKLVDGVTKLTKIEHQSEHSKQAENFRKLLLAMSEDIRVLLVKLADRVHNMRTLDFIGSEEKRARIAHETMEIYAPLAERIGIQRFKNELQDLAFKELHPEARNSISNRLEFLRNKGQNLVEKIINEISEIVAEAGIKATVTGREKTPCSIWQKMDRKNVGFEQLSDIIAFRVMVDNISECYHVLGVIHSKFHNVPDSFKDFISNPKENGYQSLHTVVIGPEQQRIEIQIRTKEMHEVAQLGVAAHWSYKQNHNYSVDGKQYKWLRELLEILDQAQDPEEFLENTKMEMYYDQVFAFTPKGNLIAMPKGATPVDFAYAVHSDVGNTCVGAKINGKMVPLKTKLQNGDQVEIVCSKTQIPSPAWEKFVVTGKARSEIRKFVRSKQRSEYINLGKAIIAKCVKAEGSATNEKQLEKILEQFKRKTLEDLYESVGEGVIARQEIVRAVTSESPEDKSTSTLKKTLSFLKLTPKQPKQKENPLPIKGLIPGMALHFAGCCHPLPGDGIVGIVHTGRGITIHTADCDVLENFSSTPERWISVSWDNDSKTDMHVGRVKVVLAHEAGSLATLSSVISQEHANINNLKIINRTTDFFEILIDLEVKGAKHLSTLIASLRSKSCIYSVERFKL